MPVEQDHALNALDQKLARAAVDFAPVHRSAVGAHQLAIKPHRRADLDRGDIGDEAIDVGFASKLEQDIEIGTVGDVIEPRLP